MAQYILDNITQLHILLHATQKNTEPVIKKINTRLKFLYWKTKFPYPFGDFKIFLKSYVCINDDLNNLVSPIPTEKHPFSY